PRSLHSFPTRRSSDLHILYCTTTADVALNRINTRTTGNPNRRAHEDAQIPDDARLRTHNAFEPISLPAPTLTIDTSNGYHPALPDRKSTRLNSSHDQI